MKVEYLLTKENYGLIEETNYIEQLELDNVQIWQGENKNILFFKVVGISNLNDNLHLKYFNLCVDASFTLWNS